MKQKYMIIGHGEHGKGTVCKHVFKHLGLIAASSSYIATKLYIHPMLSGFYKSFEECYEDRRNHRELWYELIRFINRNDRTALAAIIFESHDIYDGCRDLEEFEAIKKRWPTIRVLWVSANERKPVESSGSMQLTAEMADSIIYNNKTPENLESIVKAMINAGYFSKSGI